MADDQTCDYECPILLGQTLITIGRPPITRALDRSPGTYEIPHWDEYMLTCSNLDNCGIAQYDDQGKFQDSSWDACPAYRTMKESSSPGDVFRKLSHGV